MNAHTKQQQDKVFETDFIDSQKSDPPFAHLLALSHIQKYILKGDFEVLVPDYTQIFLYFYLIPITVLGCGFLLVLHADFWLVCLLS